MASKLMQVYLRDNGICQKCGIHTIPLHQTPRTRHITKDGMVIYRDDDNNVIVKAIATVDHIIRRRDGGSNDLTNLRLYCHTCNNKRN